MESLLLLIQAVDRTEITLTAAVIVIMGNIALGLLQLLRRGELSFSNGKGSVKPADLITVITENAKATQELSQYLRSREQMGSRDQEQIIRLLEEIRKELSRIGQTPR